MENKVLDWPVIRSLHGLSVISDLIIVMSLKSSDLRLSQFPTWETLCFDIIKRYLWSDNHKGYDWTWWESCGGKWIIKIEFVPLLSERYLMGPSMSWTEKCMAMLKWIDIVINFIWFYQSTLWSRNFMFEHYKYDTDHDLCSNKISRDKRIMTCSVN